MRVLTEEGKRVKAIQESYKDSTIPLVPCSQGCDQCYEDAPDPEPEEDDDAPDSQSQFFDYRLYESESEYSQGYRLGKKAGLATAKEVEVSFAEIQRLTLENSLLRGELATLRAHAKLSREG